MFSGLIPVQGTVHGVEHLARGGMTLRIACPAAVALQIEPKDSVAVNGVCLTATNIAQNIIGFDVVPETMERSTLGRLQAGERINLELSLRLGDRIGGHFVYGHVDATAQILLRTAEGQGERISVGRPRALAPMLCEKAFVSVDGVSLTIASVTSEHFELALIPETLARTTLGERRSGSWVNIEVDPLARYAVAALDAHIGAPPSRNEKDR